MSLLDQVVGAITSPQGEGGSSLASGVMQMINGPQTGGLASLVQSFHDGGLGEIVNSWVSTGENLPISAEQIQQVLGNHQLQGLASQYGIDPNQLSCQLAQLLPEVINKLTPGGVVPSGNDLMAEGLDLLKGKLFG